MPRCLSFRPSIGFCRSCLLLLFVLGAGLGLAFAGSGCTPLGVLAAKTTTVKVKPNYFGLKGQTVGVMTYCTRPLRIDHPALQLDISKAVQGKLKNAADKAEELKGARFPKSASPEAMYAYQQNNPGSTDTILEVAPHLGVTRLIYIEVDEFTLHPESVPDLFRGALNARVQVIEVADGKAKVAFDEMVRASFPDKAPEEGLPDLGEQNTYIGTVNEFATQVLQRFVTYEDNI